MQNNFITYYAGYVDFGDYIKSNFNNDYAATTLTFKDYIKK